MVAIKNVLFSLLFTGLNCKKFIVHLKKEVSENFLESETRFFTKESSNLVDAFNIGDFKGYIMEYDSFPIHLFEYSMVDTIEEDSKVSIDRKKNQKIFDFSENPFSYDDYTYNKNKGSEKSFYVQENPVWGLDRSDQRLSVLNKKYYYPVSSGKNVNVFIVDTGIDVNHQEFEGRAIWGINTVDSINTDCNSHGTHVAGTIGSKTFGLAKKTNLIAVKVLDCQGSGSYSGILKGLEYVIQTHTKNKGTPSVVNMSLGGPKSASINKAVIELTKAGVHTVVAAGNENSDACDTSPASEDSVMTVGATSVSNEMAQFSNWGKCVDILAPGLDIVSTVPSGKTESMSGTSMASPHVAGAYAVILGEKEETRKMTTLELKNLISTGCTKNVIKKMKTDTVNCLLFSLI